MVPTGTKVQGVYRWARQALDDCTVELEERGFGYEFRIRKGDAILFEHKDTESQDHVKPISDWIIDELARRDRLAKMHVGPGIIEKTPPKHGPKPTKAKISVAEVALRRRIVERLMSERLMVDPDHVAEEVLEEMGRRYNLRTIRADMRIVLTKWEKADEAARPGLFAMYLRRILKLAEKMEVEASAEPKVYGPLVKLYETVGKVLGTTTKTKVEHEVKTSKFEGWSREEKIMFAKHGKVTPERMSQLTGGDGDDDADGPTVH